MIKQSIEKLSHLQCRECKAWWAIGDLDEWFKKNRHEDTGAMYCPNCGKLQEIENENRT